MPRRKSSWTDNLVLLPWWVSLALAIMAYVLLPAILPPLMRGLIPITTFFFVAMAAISALWSWNSFTFRSQPRLSPKYRRFAIYSILRNKS